MKNIFIKCVLFLFSVNVAIAQDNSSKVLLYYDTPNSFGGSSGFIITQENKSANTSLKLAEKGKTKEVEVGMLENTIKNAINTLANSMRGTCAKEMETSISVTAGGNGAIIGVSLTGAMRMTILNPEMPKNCGK